MCSYGELRTDCNQQNDANVCGYPVLRYVAEDETVPSCDAWISQVDLRHGLALKGLPHVQCATVR